MRLLHYLAWSTSEGLISLNLTGFRGNNLWSTNDHNPVPLQLVNHLQHRLMGLAFRFCAGTNHFSRAEDRGRGLRLLQRVNQTRKLLRAVLDPWEDPDDRVEVYPLVQCRRGYDILNVDERPTLVGQDLSKSILDLQVVSARYLPNYRSLIDTPLGTHFQECFNATN